MMKLKLRHTSLAAFRFTFLSRCAADFNPMLKIATRVLFALLLVVGTTLLAWQAVPPTETDDPNPEWPGQKLACNNYHDNAHPCECALATSCDAHRQPNPDLSGNGMGARCKTYCRKDHCHCISPCTS